MTGPEGNSEFCFPRILMFPETKSRETLRFDIVICYIAKQNKSKILKTALRFQPSRATAVNSELLTG